MVVRRVLKFIPFPIRFIALIPLGVFIVIAQKLGFNPWNVNAEEKK